MVSSALCEYRQDTWVTTDYDAWYGDNVCIVERGNYNDGTLRCPVCDRTVPYVLEDASNPAASRYKLALHSNPAYALACWYDLEKHEQGIPWRPNYIQGTGWQVLSPAVSPAIKWLDKGATLHPIEDPELDNIDIVDEACGLTAYRLALKWQPKAMAPGLVPGDMDGFAPVFIEQYDESYYYPLEEYERTKEQLRRYGEFKDEFEQRWDEALRYSIGDVELE